ncbi:MAG: hypothetical protein RLZ12_10 [Bacillota bacterium]
MSTEIHKSVRLGQNVTLAENIVLKAGVVLGNDVTIGPGTIIYEETQIADHVTIGAQTVLGMWPKLAKSSTALAETSLAPLLVKCGASIGNQVIIYRGTSLAENVFVGDQVFIRDHVLIDKDVLLGRGVAIEQQVTIGSRTKVQTNAYITAHSSLAEDVFIAPGVLTTNDNFMGRTEARFKQISGPTIKRGARVGGGAILLPGITIAEETFVAASTVLTKDTVAGHLYMGTPGRQIRPVAKNERIYF